MNIFESCPILASERFTLRLFSLDDCDDLIEVYGDKNALPFFNSDNCHGDNFYYPTRIDMLKALDFWDFSYKKGYFVRLTILDNNYNRAIGTVEVCYRVSGDEFNNMGILRVDVRSDYENEDVLFDIFSIVTPCMKDLLGCKGTITKAPIYAIERIKAIKKVGFVKSECVLVAPNGKTYSDYWTI